MDFVKMISQPSTWRGLGIVAASVFGGFNPEMLIEVVSALGALIGGVEIARDERA